MQRPIGLTAAIAILSSCGSSPPAAAPVRKEIKVHGQAQQQLAAAPLMYRNIALKRAIYDSGGVCKLLTASNALGDYKNLAMWRASCADGKSWAVFIAPDGSAQVRPCGDLRDLKLPECDVADSKTAGTRPAVPNAAARSR